MSLRNCKAGGGRLQRPVTGQPRHCYRNRGSRASSRASSSRASGSSDWCSARGGGGPGAAPAELAARRSRHGCLALMADMPITNERQGQLQKHLIENLAPRLREPAPPPPPERSSECQVPFANGYPLQAGLQGYPPPPPKRGPQSPTWQPAAAGEIMSITLGSAL